MALAGRKLFWIHHFLLVSPTMMTTLHHDIATKAYNIPASNISDSNFRSPASQTISIVKSVRLSVHPIHSYAGQYDLLNFQSSLSIFLIKINNIKLMLLLPWERMARSRWDFNANGQTDIANFEGRGRTLLENLLCRCRRFHCRNLLDWGDHLFGIWLSWTGCSFGCW